MSITCPQCSQPNPGQSGFCIRCGATLQPVNQPPTNPSPFAYTAPNAVPPTQQAAYAASPYAPPPPASPGYPTVSPIYAPPPPPAQMGTGQGLASLRRAFAGHGTQIKLHSWLLPGQHTHAIPVLSAVNDMLGQRNIFGLNFKPDRLSERGLAMEPRDYLVVRRGVSTVFVYAAPAGKDLYISRATTVQPAISQFRVVLLGLTAFILLFGPFILGSAIASAAASAGTNPSLGLAALLPVLFVGFVFVAAYIPLLTSLIWLIVLSIINWVLDKDLWIYLRPNTLNSFESDDVSLLELETDCIVHDSVQQLGLDASLITPPSQGYEPKRKIRVI